MPNACQFCFKKPLHVDFLHSPGLEPLRLHDDRGLEELLHLRREAAPRHVRVEPGAGGASATSRQRRQRASVGKISANVARFRSYRHQYLQLNTRCAAFFKIYQILKLKFLKFDKILQILRHLQFFAEISRKLLFFQTDFLRKF